MRRRLSALPWIFAALLVLALAAGPAAAAQDAPKPQLLAVKFHADWCGSCKKMGTAFEDLRNKFDGKPVLFVELDRTNVSTRQQAALLASALGLGNVYGEHAGTGFVLLLDGASREIVAKLTADLTLKEMGAELEAKLSP